MRIIAGAWRGRKLIAPEGEGTRPTADRVRQALFDRLLHASWAGREAVEDAHVLDAFAGTGSLGMEALSRGAARAVFIEKDPAALKALRLNVATTEGRGRVLAGDALRPPPGQPCSLIFLDPPYGSGLVGTAIAALARAGWVGPDALIVAELGLEDTAPAEEFLADWTHGTARMVAWRAPGASAPTE
jgi:16S rRNA (guanine966-N2)-methyltransferase